MSNLYYASIAKENSCQKTAAIIAERKKYPMYQALERGDIEEVKRMLDENEIQIDNWVEYHRSELVGKELNDTLIMTAPMIVVNSSYYRDEQQRIDMLELIINHPNSKDKICLGDKFCEETTLEQAAKGHLFKLCIHFIEKYPHRIASFDPTRVAIIAIKSREFEIFDLMLNHINPESYLEVNFENNMGESLLLAAYEIVNLDIFKKVINFSRKFDLSMELSCTEESIIEKAIFDESCEELEILLNHPNTRRILDLIKKSPALHNLCNCAQRTKNARIISLVSTFLIGTNNIPVISYSQKCTY